MINTNYNNEQQQILDLWRELFQLIDATLDKNQLEHLINVCRNFGQLTKNVIDGPYSYDLMDFAEDKIRLGDKVNSKDTPAYKNLWPK
jgi:hypothetical protein